MDGLVLSHRTTYVIQRYDAGMWVAITSECEKESTAFEDVQWWKREGLASQRFRLVRKTTEVLEEF